MRGRTDLSVTGRGMPAAMDLSFELTVRIAAYSAVFGILAAWELLAPRRQLAVGRKLRWANNLAVFIVDALAVRLLIPTAAVGAAVLASDRGWGLLNALALP